MKTKTTRSELSSDQPNAWIVNPHDRGRKSIKSGNSIYLIDGDPFEIELHNPLPESVLADVRVNGKSVSKTGLVLRPAERFYLDCFIDDKKKFSFKTYDVEDSKESTKAIAKNGMIEVYFYKEETIKFNNWVDVFRPIYHHHYHHYPYWNYPLYPYWNYPSSTVTIGTSGNNLYNTVCTTNLSNTSLNITGNDISNNTYSTNSMGIGNNFNACIGSIYNTGVVSNIETGRIEKGELSEQNFTEVDMEFQKCYISSVIYNLLPESRKPIETKDAKKKFCTECGNKLSGNEKFCPECGDKL